MLTSMMTLSSVTLSFEYNLVMSASRNLFGNGSKVRKSGPSMIRPVRSQSILFPMYFMTFVVSSSVSSGRLCASLVQWDPTRSQYTSMACSYSVCSVLCLEPNFSNWFVVDIRSMKSVIHTSR